MIKLMSYTLVVLLSYACIKEDVTVSNRSRTHESPVLYFESLSIDKFLEENEYSTQEYPVLYLESMSVDNYLQGNGNREHIAYNVGMVDSVRLVPGDKIARLSSKGILTTVLSYDVSVHFKDKTNEIYTAYVKIRDAKQATNAVAYTYVPAKGDGLVSSISGYKVLKYVKVGEVLGYNPFLDKAQKIWVWKIMTDNVVRDSTILYPIDKTNTQFALKHEHL